MVWLEIGKLLMDIFKNHKEEKKEERERLHALFLEMSQLLEGTAVKLENDVYPHGDCQAMELLCVGLVAKLKPMIPFNELDMLTDQLMKASKLELEFATRKDPTTIETIRTASGTFKALSILYI